jgi:hypothetical protein
MLRRELDRTDEVNRKNARLLHLRCNLLFVSLTGEKLTTDRGVNSSKFKTA